MECIFCKIISGEIPSYTIYEDDIVKVFLDIHPDFDGHMLIIPKKHIIDLEDIDLDTLGHINKISKQMYQLLKDRLGTDGLTVVQNSGIAEDVKHFHVHLLPKYIGGKTYLNDKTNLTDIETIYELFN